MTMFSGHIVEPGAYDEDDGQHSDIAPSDHGAKIGKIPELRKRFMRKSRKFRFFQIRCTVFLLFEKSEAIAAGKSVFAAADVESSEASLQQLQNFLS